MEKYYNKNYYNIETVHDIVKKMIMKPYSGDSIKLELIRKDWSSVIGEKMCKYTKAEKIYKNVLYVNCIHQGWINTLQFYKDVILDNVSEKYGEIIELNDVKFKYGPIK